MTFDLAAWLAEPVDGKPQTTRADHLCYLLYANGGWQVRGWGVLSWTAGGHQQGLEQDEAIALIAYGGFVQGLVAAGVPFHALFIPTFKAYREKYEPESPRGPVNDLARTD